MSTIRINQDNMLEWAVCYWEQNIWIKKESRRIERLRKYRMPTRCGHRLWFEEMCGMVLVDEKRLLKSGHNSKGLMSNAAFCLRECHLKKQLNLTMALYTCYFQYFYILLDLFTINCFYYLIQMYFVY